MWRLAVLLLSLRAWAGSCEGLATLALADATVDKAEAVRTGTFAAPTGAPIQNLPAFCRVVVTSRPSNDSEIGIEIWMPEKNWNGRLEGTGNGGFAGRISYGALANGVKLGYAVVNTDMGMATTTMTALWAARRHITARASI
jgi:feruloyl esterase